MLFTTFETNGKEYKCALTISAAIMAEKKLGENPINVMVDMANNSGRLPDLEKLIIILHASLQKYQHNLKMEDVEAICDDYISEGHDLTDLIMLITEIIQESGFIKMAKEDTESKNSKKRAGK